MNKRIALVDGGEVLWRVGCGSEIRRYRIYPKNEQSWINSFSYKKDAVEYCEKYGGALLDNGNYEELFIEKDIKAVSIHTAKLNLESFLKTIKNDTEAEHLIVCFGNLEGLNFRHELASFNKYKDRPPYKPLLYYHILDAILSNYATQHAGELDLEDDDVLAILYNELKQEKCEPIICSHDKDMLQVPGLHYHTDKKELFEVSVVQGLRSFYNQLYTGDAIDTIPGFYEITGQRKATKKVYEYIDKLEDESDMYQYVLSLYQATLGAKDIEDLECILYEIGNLLYLRRSWDDKGWSMI